MSAQQRNWFDRLVDFFFLKPNTPGDTGWQRTPPVPERQSAVAVPLFGGPVHVGPPGSWARDYYQRSGALPQVAVRQTHLTAEQRKSLIEQIDTQRELSKRDLERFTRGAHIRAPRLVSLPEPETPGWLQDVEADAKRGPSGYLLSLRKAEVLAVTEQDMQPDLSEDDPDATEAMKAEYRGAPTLRKLLEGA